FLVNLIDSPGHADFSYEVTAALRITDGALVVVDCIEGVCVETETVLRQRLCENLRPVLLTVNKMDKCLLELDVDNDEDVYMMLKGVIDDTNAVLRDAMVSPVEGTVAFSSGLYGWAFTLRTFSEMYATLYGYNELKLRNRLWGDNYYDRKKRKWTNYDTGAAS
ncbi:elongation factor 2, partial [Tanacetum coccineum]